MNELYVWAIEMIRNDQTMKVLITTTEYVDNMWTICGQCWKNSNSVKLTGL